VTGRKLTDLKMTYHHQTEMAVLVSLHGVRGEAEWLPKSAIEVDVDYDELVPGKKVEVTLPVDLAIEKGLA
jgi:hypothetical protein